MSLTEVFSNFQLNYNCCSLTIGINTVAVMQRIQNKALTFLLMNGVTSMSLEGTPMALTRSILINLFINLELNNFLPPLLQSIVFVQECSVVCRF